MLDLGVIEPVGSIGASPRSLHWRVFRPGSRDEFRPPTLPKGEGPHGEQRPLAELPQKSGQPEPADTERSQDVHPVEVEVGLRKDRSDQPEDVHQTHEDDEPGGEGQEARILVGRPRKQEQERQQEVEEDQGQAD